MALPKDPRQLMINLMYLVLTAMLAMNITKEVLNAFLTINSSIEGSNVSITGKNDQIYESFDKAESNPSEKEKVKPYNDLAKQIRAESQQLVNYLQAWKDTVIERSGGWEVDDKGNKQIKSLEDIDAATRLFVEEKKGDEVKAKLNGFVQFLLERVNAKDREAMAKAFPIQLPDLPKSDDNPTGDWSFGTFHNIPVVATVAMLSKFQNDVKNSESIVLEHLMSQIHLEDYKFDALTAIAVPKTSYALEGQEIEATIMLAAYNKSANPTISGGNVVVKDGVGTMKFKASGAGLKTVNGVITIDKAGKKESYPYKFEYMVGSAGASLQLDKMNVMYIGVPNPITLSASGYNIEDVKLNMPDATLTSTGKGKYVATVTKQGTIEYSINASRGGAQGGKISGGQIRVKMIPPPTAMIGARPVSMMPANQAKVQQGILAKLDNFDFEANFKVTSFRFVYIPKTGDAVPVEVKGNAFDRQCQELINRSRPGDKWLVENVKAIGPDNIQRSINSVSLTLN
jgi:gliding motility-associated protein GldM